MFFVNMSLGIHKHFEKIEKKCTLIAAPIASSENENLPPFPIYLEYGQASWKN
jgi:hypothetical protein